MSLTPCAKDSEPFDVSTLLSVAVVLVSFVATSVQHMTVPKRTAPPPVPTAQCPMDMGIRPP